MQNLQCDWLRSVHYNSTMHAVFFVSWETNVTKFSVVFTHKLLYNAMKNSVKTKEKKQIENKRKKRAKQNDKIQTTFVTVFAEYEFD